MGVHSREADVFLAPRSPHYKAFFSTALTIHSFTYSIITCQVVLCASLFADINTSLGGTERNRKGGGRRKGGSKCGWYGNCRVSGGPDISCPHSRPQHTDTHGLSKANAELQGRREGEKGESSPNKIGRKERRNGSLLGSTRLSIFVA